MGRGNSATVYLAQDSRAGGNDSGWVALKALDPGWLGSDPEEAAQRFAQEVAIVRRLRHPDVVALHDQGVDKGRWWLAMDLAPGVSLDRYTDPRRLLPPSVVLGLGARVADALAHAHAQGVVHRDIKPSNVLVDLPQRSLKVTDFGTARLIDGYRTRTGLLLGSPAYLAPEMLAGEVGDARSDLYSLGVLLFQLLAGRLPHHSSSMGELLRLAVSQPAPSLRALRPETPATVSDAVAGLLAKRADDRPSSADATARQLLALRDAAQSA